MAFARKDSFEKARKLSITHKKSENFILKSFERAGANKEAANDFLKQFTNYQYAAKEMERSGWTPSEIEESLKRHNKEMSSFLELKRKYSTSVLSHDVYQKLKKQEHRLPSVSYKELDSGSRSVALKEDFDSKKSVLTGLLAGLGNGIAEKICVLAKKRADLLGKAAKIPIFGKIVAHLHSDAKFLAEFLKSELDSFKPTLENSSKILSG